MPAIITDEVFFGLLSLILAFYFVLISNLILLNTYKTTAAFLEKYNQIFNNHKSEIHSAYYTVAIDRTSSRASNSIDTIGQTSSQAINRTNTIDQTSPWASNRTNTIDRTSSQAMNRTNTIGQTTPQTANCTETNIFSETIILN